MAVKKIAVMYESDTAPTGLLARAFSIWVDTSGDQPVLKMRNKAKTDWIPIYTAPS